MINISVVYVVAVLLIRTALLTSAQRIINYGGCITPNGDRAYCIALEQCTFLYNMLIQPGIKNSDKLYLTRSQCGSNNGKILVCCRSDHIGTEQSKSTKTGLLPEPGTCGNVMSNRIHGGTVTELDEFPWLALILYDNNYEEKHLCAGSLISERYVLTVAHCFRRVPEAYKPVAVRFGEWDVTTDLDCKTQTNGKKDCADEHVEIPIQTIIVHPDYVGSSTNQLHDIALVRMLRTVNYTDFIKPICLPIKESLKELSFDGIAMDIAGWGITETGKTSNIKRKAVVKGVPLSTCQDVYKQRKLNIQSSQLCAGGEVGVDACFGDSGGPLIAVDTSNKSRSYSYVAGLVSLGMMRCGLQGVPGVYTKVSDYLDWILQNILP